MPLRDPFDERVETIRAFLEVPAFTTLAIRHEPDTRQLLLRVLVGLEEEDGPHAILFLPDNFSGYRTYSECLLEEISAHVEAMREDLVVEGVQLPRAPEAANSFDEHDPRPGIKQLANYFSAIADALPDSIGSFALILDPESVTDRGAFAWWVEALTAYTESEWVKYMVPDSRAEPAIAPSEHVQDRVYVLEFDVPPEELEEQVHKDLEAGRLSAAARRRHLMLAGAFATSGGRPEDARKHLEAALRETQEAGADDEEANVLYNLGNLDLREGHIDSALARFTRSAQLCVENELNPLLAMVLTNLGVALHRAGRSSEALESFAVARRTFAALGHKPGEAHVLDNRARTLVHEGRETEARAVWLEARAIYESITAPHLADVREAGCQDIDQKLARHGGRPGGSQVGDGDGRGTSGAGG